jgi:hypothetical protein
MKIQACSGKRWLARSGEKPEVDFYTGADFHGCSIDGARIEVPLLYRFDFALVETEARAVDYADLFRSSVCVDNDAEGKCGLDMRASGLIAESRIGFRNYRRRGLESGGRWVWATHRERHTEMKMPVGRLRMVFLYSGRDQFRDGFCAVRLVGARGIRETCMLSHSVVHRTGTLMDIGRCRIISRFLYPCGR